MRVAGSTSSMPCLKQHKVRMMYITPHHQFPTTVSLPAGRRQQLLELARQHAFCVVEEDYDYEYHFAGRPYLPLASDRQQRHVIYIGSLSSLWAARFVAAISWHRWK